MAPTYINGQGQCGLQGLVGCPDHCSQCVSLPPAVTVTGSFVVQSGVETCAGNTPDTGGASLPVQVEFFPLSSLAPVTSADAVSLPLLPVVGLAQGSNSAPTLGPGHTPGTNWTAMVGAGLYEEDIVPIDTTYPPERVQGQIAAGLPALALSTISSLDECGGGTTSSQTTFTVTRADGGSLAGFSTYLRDATTLRRVSSVASFVDGSSGTATLLTIGMWPPTSALQLVVAPPEGSPIPTYADNILVSQTQLNATTFPALPPPVTVTGEVDGPDGAPIDADLVIDSTAPGSTGGQENGGIAICVNGDCSPPAYASTPRPLAFSTGAHATAGRYSVVLPPGDYDVFIVPALGAAASATLTDLSVQWFANAPPIAEGKTLQAVAPATIAGIAKLANGSPLVGATVEARPSASLPGATPPIPRTHWPRTWSALTDGTGAFTMAVDPGTYDVVVEPVGGTGFPWVTAVAKGVASGDTLAFDPIVVPAPILIDMTLQAADTSPAAGAIVRAFTTPASATYAIELGTWQTDDDGRFVMYVAPPQ
jgi:hypothetical protein